MIGACKKIVRLILMSNISRRKFLKGAGVAALAVAAAGVLTGCDGNSSSSTVPGTNVPEQDGVTSEVIDVLFKDEAGNTLATDTMTILKGNVAVEFKRIPLDNMPKGYGVESDAPLKVQDVGGEKRAVIVKVKKGTVNDAENKDNGEVTLKKVTIPVWNYADSSKTQWVVNVLIGDKVTYADIKDTLHADFPGMDAMNPAWESYVKPYMQDFAAETPLMINLVG